MPTRQERKDGIIKWRGVVKKGGVRVAQKTFDSFEEAKAWEDGIKSGPDCPTLEYWINCYLDDAFRRMDKEILSNKKRELKKFVSKSPLDSDNTVDAVDENVIVQYLSNVGLHLNDPSARVEYHLRTMNAAWNWGRCYVKGFPTGENPFTLRSENRTYLLVPFPEETLSIIKVGRAVDIWKRRNTHRRYWENAELFWWGRRSVLHEQYVHHKLKQLGAVVPGILGSKRYEGSQEVFDVSPEDVWWAIRVIESTPDVKEY